MTRGPEFLASVIIIVICVAIFLTPNRPTKAESDQPVDIPVKLTNGEYLGEVRILVIDGCEYIAEKYSAVPLMHKGNCKNH